MLRCYGLDPVIEFPRDAVDDASWRSYERRMLDALFLEALISSAVMEQIRILVSANCLDIFMR